MAVLDPGISTGITDLFQVLSANPGCHGFLYSHVIPIVTDILTSTSDALPLGLVAVRHVTCMMGYHAHVMSNMCVVCYM